MRIAEHFAREGLSRRGILLAGAAAGVLTACGARTGRAFLSSDTHPADYPTVTAVDEMARLLRERTDGRLDIKTYAGGQLGSERDTLEITVFGGLDMNRVNLAPLNAIEPVTTIPALPFLFRSNEHMRRALDSSIGDEILASLTKHGLIGLCFYDSGDRNFYNTKRPIYTPADMKGMKIRVPNSDLYVSMIKALGADATPMSIAEVYQALVQGVIDGAENNWPSYESGRHFEVASYYSLSHHVIAPEVLVMSKRRWDKLDKADQERVRQAAKDSVPFMRANWDAAVDAARTKLLAAGVKVNEIADPVAFAAAMRPVWDKYVVSDDQKRLVKQIEAMAEEG
ncbi:MAG: TRAP transporter substrate-binding protein [Hyphomonas sp.]|uniref:TRAP transporter substrate-binding protein n=1 Tax=Hyphomonas sp. TaxID=87 RepID=UPI0017CD5C11|nr:TRAP transporter substrate-binding protein [Hyphomonas sp.]MBU3920983.1 TRAP transporter substrate-binding protein [Alphaproteobacteria bacterium]MBA3069939.1 TRAP transporter substrate-binding protein [Hyphomonas sp.]MBU4060485.1 TRAP transporter substrate-binding protein [Alphaproteobacteria bacterium]MBU4163153.1 TRAP transporter substrate-binding protein [Alphaproteobacteria bacterium]MBU4568116.1 TRAP transporter substrate-binding protein [Alphaproteobacteria bacterium]